MQKTSANSEVKSYNKLGLMSKPNKNKMSVKLGRNKFTYGFIDLKQAGRGGINAFDYLTNSSYLPSIQAKEGDVAWVVDKECFMTYDGYDWVDATEYNDELETALFRYDGVLYYYDNGTLISLDGNTDISSLELRVSDLEGRMTTAEGNITEINDWINQQGSDIHYEEI